jgi:hypothetical protein
LQISLVPKIVQRADIAPNGKPFGSCTTEEGREFSLWYSMLTNAAQNAAQEYERRARGFEQLALGNDAARKRMA